VYRTAALITNKAFHSKEHVDANTFEPYKLLATDLKKSDIVGQKCQNDLLSKNGMVRILVMVLRGEPVSNKLLFSDLFYQQTSVAAFTYHFGGERTVTQTVTVRGVVCVTASWTFKELRDQQQKAKKFSGLKACISYIQFENSRLMHSPRLSSSRKETRRHRFNPEGEQKFLVSIFSL
jgi:hypothetical protein